MTVIRFRRGYKADLPSIAPSGMPLWCEDTKQLYLGTGSGVELINDLSKIEPFVYVPYSCTSGKSDSNGRANFISKVNNSTIKIEAGSESLIICYPNGTIEKISNDLTISGITLNEQSAVIVKELGDNILKAMGLPNCVDVSTTGNYISNHSSGVSAFDKNIITQYVSYIMNWGNVGNAYVGQNNIQNKVKKVIITQPYGADGNATPIASCPTWKLQWKYSADSSWTDIQTFNVSVNGLSVNTFDVIDYNAVGTHQVRIVAMSAPWGHYALGRDDYIALAEVNFLTEVSGNKITESIQEPTSPVDGDYWLNYGLKPMKSYRRISGAWVETQFVKLGEFTRMAGVIGTPVSYAFNAIYNSGEQDIPSDNSSLLLNHNIGCDPEISAYLVCKAAQLGYNTGDKIEFPLITHNHWDGGSDDITYPCVDYNSMKFSFNKHNNIAIANKSSNNGIAGITNTNWKIVFRAKRRY